VNGQSLVLARIDTMRHYDQQLNAYQKDGRLLAAQGQKLEHIEEKVQGNNARVEQVGKVVQSLQEKGKDAPMVWPGVAAGGGLLATIGGLGTALYFWKKHQSRKAKTVQGGLYSETEDDSEIDSGVDRFRSQLGQRRRSQERPGTKSSSSKPPSRSSMESRGRNHFPIIWDPRGLWKMYNTSRVCYVQRSLKQGKVIWM